MNKYLKFEEKLSESGKTKRLTVFAMNDIALGSISWHGPWRKYVFFPNPQTLFDPYCLTEVVEKLKDLQKEHKEK
jgi:hypothetical protein